MERVTRSGIDSDGDILSLCGPSFGKVRRSIAIAKIKQDPTSYYVAEETPSVYVKVGIRNGAEYITTHADT